MVRARSRCAVGSYCRAADPANPGAIESKGDDRVHGFSVIVQTTRRHRGRKASPFSRKGSNDFEQVPWVRLDQFTASERRHDRHDSS
jgi:hypothetical protein